jgi:hypothetical protein
MFFMPYNARRSGQIEVRNERKFDPPGAACYALLAADTFFNLIV